MGFGGIQCPPDVDRAAHRAFELAAGRPQRDPRCRRVTAISLLDRLLDLPQAHVASCGTGYGPDEHRACSARGEPARMKGVAVGTVTLLFTDIEGSTRL